MPTPAEQAETFYREVAATHEVYGVAFDDDAGGVPTWPAGQEMSVRPFWSSPSTAEKMLPGLKAKRPLKIVRLGWTAFVRETRDMRTANQIVGLNWFGVRSRGYNLPPETVVEAVEHAMKSAG